MYIVKKRKYIVVTFLAILFFVSKLHAEENVKDKDLQESVSSDTGNGKVQEAKSEDSDRPPASVEDKLSNSKLEKVDPHAPVNADVQHQNIMSEENAHLPVQVADSQNTKENVEGCENPPGTQEEKVEDSKLEAVHAPEGEDQKKPIQKEGDNEKNHKINLNDVNCLIADDYLSKQFKRDTKNRYTDFLGMPRDASYFFDDLEPFINNNSNNRVDRSAPTREGKSQKSKFNGKKDNTEDDADEEEVEIDEENEKMNEEEYDDDDEDMGSDCKPSTQPCKTSSTCHTTTKCSPTTKPITTKSTEVTCSTPCATETKCPRICAKVNRKKIGCPVTKKSMMFDMDKKRIINKRRFHSKINANGS